MTKLLDLDSLFKETFKGTFKEAMEEELLDIFPGLDDLEITLQNLDDRGLHAKEMDLRHEVQTNRLRVAHIRTRALDTLQKITGSRELPQPRSAWPEPDSLPEKDPFSYTNTPEEKERKIPVPKVLEMRNALIKNSTQQLNRLEKTLTLFDELYEEKVKKGIIKSREAKPCSPLSPEEKMI